MTDQVAQEAVGRQRPAGSQKRWAALLGWLLLIWAFIFVFAPWLQQQSTAVGKLGKYVNESGIDAGALYYTEVDAVGDADMAIRNTMRFYVEEE